MRPSLPPKFLLPSIFSSPRTFVTSAVRSASTTQRRKHRDPYAVAQAAARKAANISRQIVLRKERAAALGDPVRGVSTPFVQSFDTIGLRPDMDFDVLDLSKPAPKRNDDDVILNYALTDEELNASIVDAEWLARPIANVSSQPGEYRVDNIEAQHNDRLAKHDKRHDRAEEAIRRITDMAMSNSKDRLRMNIQRCIDQLGRHKTDPILPPRNPSTQSSHEGHDWPMPRSSVPRVGRDTGSSEVQIAILTAKIRNLANGLEAHGRTDKINKRNLRLLVHRRQKLLAYLRRQDRGGPRWQNCIETLGLTEGTWKGEISL